MAYMYLWFLLGPAFCGGGGPTLHIYLLVSVRMVVVVVESSFAISMLPFE